MSLILSLSSLSLSFSIRFSILLLAEGRTAYMGATAKAIPYFQRYRWPMTWKIFVAHIVSSSSAFVGGCPHTCGLSFLANINRRVLLTYICAIQKLCLCQSLLDNQLVTPHRMVWISVNSLFCLYWIMLKYNFQLTKVLRPFAQWETITVFCSWKWIASWQNI